MNEIIGIDLGTTNSMAAWVSEVGAEVIEDKNLSSWQASVVCYAEGKFIVGSEACQIACNERSCQCPIVCSLQKALSKLIGDTASTVLTETEPALRNVLVCGLCLNFESIKKQPIRKYCRWLFGWLRHRF